MEHRKSQFAPQMQAISPEIMERLPKRLQRILRSPLKKPKRVICRVCESGDEELRRLVDKLRERGFTFRETSRLTGFSLGCLHRHEKHATHRNT